MRNLQKILALALALIMSFSLVVTANAAFSDEADINETYAESVNVLSGLEVFRGYTDGSYKPQASITRAEVAAIIYRIATGDVNDTQVSIYSDWNRFSDVTAGSWYAGYVNYCANAEYIQGYGDGRFGPNDPVTGYQALAMILRAVGYGKMDEFTGSNWAVQTAARANTLKVSRNVTSALLNSPASREVVAELLFRSILVPTVDYNQFSGYTETDTTLGANLGLEAVKGVVVANEEADLYSEEVLAEGKTNLEVGENDVRTLDYTSTLDDIGESRYAYIVDSKVLALGDTGENVKWETGDKTNVDTDKKFRDKSGLNRTDDTEFYVNFGREGHFSCDQRLEFTVTFYHEKAETSFNTYEDISKYAYAQNTNSESDDDWTVEVGTSAGGWTKVTSTAVNYEDLGTPVRYNRIIRANEEITQEEMNILEGIFAAADNDHVNGQERDRMTGDVFVGTKSTNSETDEERDISNSISFRKFKDEYINSEAWDRNFNGNDRGEWLKIVDCDSDGDADYAFLTEYWLDKITGSYTKSGETLYEFEVLDVEDWDVVDYNDYEPAVGDVTLHTQIDNKVTIVKAEILTDKIQTVSFRDETVTTVGGETKKQSEITNSTRMDETITNMEDGVEYNMYLDRYGNIRAYELAAGTKYALLTELYYDRAQNSQYVRNADLIAEITAGDEDTTELKVLNNSSSANSNRGDNDFLLDEHYADNWDDLYRDEHLTSDWREAYKTRTGREDARLRIVLQPAINSLALRHQAPNVTDIFDNAATNVARYVQTDDGVRITSAAQYARDKSNNKQYYYDKVNGVTDYTTRTTDYVDGLEPVYKYNYIELTFDGKDIPADERHYPIASDDDMFRNIANYGGNYVNAVHDTEYYIVNRESGKIEHFVDYENLMKIDASIIEAVYAVAENTEADNNARDYWIADVIVIEVSDWVGDVDNVALVFDNYQQTSGRVRYLDTLATEFEGVNAHVVPKNESWGARWDTSRHGFYLLYDTEVDGEELMSDEPGRIVTGSYNKYGVYAGQVTRTDGVQDRGGYIDVDLYGGLGEAEKSNTVVKTDRVTLPNRSYVYAIDGREAVGGLTVSNSNHSDLQVGDHIIWVEDSDKHTVFIVIISDEDFDAHDHDWDTPDWLWNEYWAVIGEQRDPNVVDAPVVKFFNQTVTPSGKSYTLNIPYATAKANDINGSDIVVTGGKIVTPDSLVSNANITLKDEGDRFVGGILGDDGNYYSFDLSYGLRDTDLGKLWSKDLSKVIITDTDSDPIEFWIPATGDGDPGKEKMSLQSLENLLTTTTGATVKLEAKDSNGTDITNLSGQMVDDASSIIAVVSKGDVSERWAIEHAASAMTKVIVTLGENVELDRFGTSADSTVDVAAADVTKVSDSIYVVPAGSVVFVQATGKGTFTNTESLAMDNQLYVVADNITAASVAASVDVTINFTLDPQTAGKITRIELDPLRLADGATMSGSLAENNLVVTVPTEDDLTDVDGFKSNLAYWFGAAQGDGSYLHIKGEGQISGYETTPDDGYPYAIMIEAEGVNGGGTDKIKVNFKAAGATEKRYTAHILVASASSGNVNIALTEFGSNTYLTNAQMEAIGVTGEGITITRTAITVDDGEIIARGTSRVGNAASFAFDGAGFGGNGTIKLRGVKEAGTAASDMLFKAGDKAIYGATTGLVLGGPAIDLDGDATEEFTPGTDTTVEIEINIPGINVVAYEGVICAQ